MVVVKVFELADQMVEVEAVKLVELKVEKMDICLASELAEEMVGWMVIELDFYSVVSKVGEKVVKKVLLLGEMSVVETVVLLVACLVSHAVV